MTSRFVTAGLMAAAFTAVAAGSYVAVRQNHADAVPARSLGAPATVTPADPVKTETETVVIPAVAEIAQPSSPAAVPESVEPAEPVRTAPRVRRTSARSKPRETPDANAQPATEAPALVSAPEAPGTVAAERPVTDVPPVVEVETARPAEPAIEELIVPASAVIGLEIENTVTSESAQVEDRVNARVTRAVYADGHVAIPPDARVLGIVTLVERGGKMKDRARLGVRFHTLVLADGRQVPLRTETVFREGESPGAESSRKIGGAAVGGAVLGAILGGGKGAVAGAAAGAAGGTAVVMAGGRNAATLASGSVVTVRLSAPVAVEVAR